MFALAGKHFSPLLSSFVRVHVLNEEFMDQFYGSYETFLSKSYRAKRVYFRLMEMKFISY